MNGIFYLLIRIIKILFQIISSIIIFFFNILFKNAINSKELRVKNPDSADLQSVPTKIGI